MKRKLLCALLSLLLLVSMLPVLPVSAAATNDGWWLEDLALQNGETEADELSRLRADNSTALYNEKAPLNNLYDDQVANGGASLNIYQKGFALNGDYANIYTGKTTGRYFFYVGGDGSTAKKGLITLVPGTAMEGKTAFTVSYIRRHYNPNNGGAFGLALFYGNAVTDTGASAIENGAYADGNAYFNGYNNYTFTGFTGARMFTYSAYSVYDDETTNFATNESLPSSVSAANAKNQSFFVSVTCTKGTWKVGDEIYTARIDAYVDTHYLVTSYAQWVDGAPIMLYYDTTNDSGGYQIGVTDIRVQASTLDTGVTLKGCQIATGTSNTFDVRFVATVDSTQYAEVGFDIYATYSDGAYSDGTYLYSKGSTTVYDALTATAKDGAAGDINYITAASQNGVYLAALAIHNIPTEIATTTFIVYPYYKNVGSNEKVVAEKGYKFVFNAGVFNQAASGEVE